MRNGAKILIIDDDASMRDACRQILERDGLEIHEAASGRDALKAMDRRLFDLVILDLKMPRVGGLDVLRSMKRQHRDIPVVVVTGYPSVDSAVEAMKNGAIDFLAKPFTSESLRVIVRKSLHYSRIEREHGLLVGQVSDSGGAAEMIGQTPQIQAIFDLVDRVAPTDSTVLVIGESGTGKELVARALHRKSARAGGPFITVDCATLVGTLFESELFGHAKGSFTGATTTTHGRFEVADGGTLFLDEIGCVELAMQAKLLRVLEQREFTRVGSNQTISVDVRVIAATNTDLPKAIEEGTFREDLFYRLSVVPVFLPPLRQRRDDIALLAWHFLELHRRTRGKDVRRISKKAMELITSHAWPGNIRELSNAIERAVVLADGSSIKPEHLLHYGVQMASEAPALGDVLTLAEVERRQIERILRHSNGNKSHAAELLGIDRKTLWRKLQRYGISLN